MESVEEQVKRLVIDTLKIKESDYREDLEAGDIPEWDSVGHVTLLMAAEEKFEITFDVNDSIDVASVEDLIDMVGKYLAMKTPA